MSLVVRILCLLLLVNIALCHSFWFEVPGLQKFSDGSDVPYDDEPLKMQKRFRVKYIRELGRLPAFDFLTRSGESEEVPRAVTSQYEPANVGHVLSRRWSAALSPQEHLINLVNTVRNFIA